MKIGWFPGHMKKALDMMKNELKNVDIIIYVLDARAPQTCINPKFKTICDRRPIIYVLNKCDMTEESITKRWSQELMGENTEVVLMDSRKSTAANIIKTKMKQMLSKKIEHNMKKGIKIPMRAMVIGVPNSGKSTLINNCVGKYKAVTGNKAGVTRGKQWVKVDENIDLLDTPGTLYPNIEDQTIANKLAFIGSVRDEVVDMAELGYALIELLLTDHKEKLVNRYNIEDIDQKQTIEIMDEICYKRGIVPKGREVDYEKTGRAVIDDFRKGRLGLITLDKFNA
ncbi:MAG: ribosome biogenesis GTPase YlqF [Clostridia bacterium]|nr:ribosome biogenesis GTPase YlqF [Clostridia bacterium]